MNVVKQAGRAAVFVASGALAMGASGAAAQPLPIDTIDQAEHLRTVNEQTVEPALAVVTGNQLTSVDAEGNAMLVATATNGLRFEVRFRACDEEPDDAQRHCRGVFIVGVWDALPEEKRDAYSDLMASYMRQNPAVNAGLMEDGSPYLVRYVIADYGTPQGNMVSEFANYIRNATDFQNTIASLYAH